MEDHEGGALRKFLAMGAFLAADGFVVHAAADRARLERLAPGRPSVVLAHPAAALIPPPESREEARRKLGLSGSEPLVLFLGLVRRYKGVDLLLEAAPEIVRRTRATIAIVGEVFPDARELLRRAEASPVRDRILWKDSYVSEEEMTLWLAACDVVALPYRAISGSGIAARAFAARTAGGGRGGRRPRGGGRAGQHGRALSAWRLRGARARGRDRARARR